MPINECDKGIPQIYENKQKGPLFTACQAISGISLLTQANDGEVKSLKTIVFRLPRLLHRVVPCGLVLLIPVRSIV